MYKWLKQLTVGDCVIRNDRFNMDTVELVTRITKTMVMVGKYNARYRKKDGQLVGAESWAPETIYEPTAEKLKEARDKEQRREYVSYLNQIVFGKLKTYELKQICGIVFRSLKEIEDAKKKEDS